MIIAGVSRYAEPSSAELKNVRVTVSSSTYSILLDLLAKGISMLSGTKPNISWANTLKCPHQPRCIH